MGSKSRNTHFLRKKSPCGHAHISTRILSILGISENGRKKSNLEKKVHNSTSTNGNKIEIGFVHTISSRRSYLEGSTPLRRRQTGLFWENRVFAWNKNASWGSKSINFLENSWRIIYNLLKWLDIWLILLLYILCYLFYLCSSYFLLCVLFV